MSQGQLKLFQTCALQWRFKYLDGVTGVQNCALTYGALIHQALELMETTADPAKAIQWFREAWGCPEAIDPSLRIQQYLPNRDYRYYADRGPDLLRKWWNVIRWDSDVVLAREHHVVVPVTGTEHELEVVPDKVVARYSAKLEREVIVISDYKSGAEHNRPKRGYLAHDIQFSAYAYATTQPEFWEGVPNGGYYYERYRDAPRFGEWVQLTSSKRWDAGERREVPHYNRLRYAINTMAEMVALRLFPPTISGESCEFCFARAQCGLAPVEQERAA